MLGAVAVGAVRAKVLRRASVWGLLVCEFEERGERLLRRGLRSAF